MRYLILLSLLVGATSLFAQDSISRADVPDLLRALHDTLVYHHPYTQDDSGRTSIQKTLDSLLATTANLPGGDSVHLSSFITHAAGFQRTIGDGHLQLDPFVSGPRKEALSTRQRYISVYDTDDEGFILLYPLPTGKGDTLPRGTIVSHLDGKPIEEIVKENSSFRGLNDHGFTDGGTRGVAYSLSYVYRLMYGLRDSTLLTFTEEPGVTVDRWIDLRYSFPKAEKKKKRSKDKSTRIGRFMKCRLLTRDSVWHLRITSFDGDDFSAQKTNYYKELKKIFVRINADPGNGLIVDLRSNGGGSINKAMELAYYLSDEPFKFAEVWDSRSPDARGKNLFKRMLWRVAGGTRREGDLYYQPNFTKYVKPYPARKRYKGPVALIVNESSFSAATMIAHTLRVTTGAPLVGAVAGGSSEIVYGGRYNFYPIGNPVVVQLRVPNMRIKMWRPRSGNLRPDHLIPITRSDMIDRDYDARTNKAIELLLELQ